MKTLAFRPNRLVRFLAAAVPGACALGIAARSFVAAALVLASVRAVLATPAADLPVAGPPCPASVVGTSKVLRLSELFATEVPREQCNAQSVQDAIFAMGQNGTFIVDRTCDLDAGLRLPSRFTLRGTGIGSEGIIHFTHDGLGLSMCQEAPRGYVTIADLDLYGPDPAGDRIVAPHATGIALANQNIVYITNVRVSDFITGLSGRQSFSVFINGSNISDNRGDNIRIDYNSNSWRIRDGLVSQAGGWGINVLGPGDAEPLGNIDGSNDLLIDGVRMESNFRGAVRTNTYGTRITNSRLEGNGKGNFSFPKLALLMDQHAQEARILTNLSSGDCIRDVGTGTQRAFNIPASQDTAECSQLPIAPN
ncbi:MAG: right-handed parallel beta-helix repeat-containing protein [Gammaproteobacteria bacterium]